MVVKQKSNTLYNVNGKDVSGLFTSANLKDVYDMMIDIQNLKGKDHVLVSMRQMDLGLPKDHNILFQKI